MERPPIDLDKLIDRFAGRPVAITHSGNSALRDGTGICKTFHLSEGGVDMETVSGNRWGFIPDTLTETSVEGNMAKHIAGRRKISHVQT